MATYRRSCHAVPHVCVPRATAAPCCLASTFCLACRSQVLISSRAVRDALATTSEAAQLASSPSSKARLGTPSWLNATQPSGAAASALPNMSALHLGELESSVHVVHALEPGAPAASPAQDAPAASPNSTPTARRPRAKPLRTGSSSKQ